MDTFGTLVRTALQYVSANPLSDAAQAYELEIRIGNLLSDGQFRSGYQQDQKHTIQTLIQSLEHASTVSDAMQALSPVTYATAYYKDGLRKSSNAGVQRKKTVFTADFKTDRHKDLRVVLSIETTLPTAALPVAEPHTSMCLLQRKSFVNGPYRFDVTKRTPKRMNKNDCCMAPCEYHVEVELDLKRVVASADVSSGASLERTVHGLVERARVLLGSHRTEASGKMTRLLPPRFVFQGARSSKQEFRRLNHVFACASPPLKKQCV